MSGRLHATTISVSGSFGASATARSNAASAPFGSPSSARTHPEHGLGERVEGVERPRPSSCTRQTAGWRRADRRRSRSRPRGCRPPPAWSSPGRSRGRARRRARTAGSPPAMLVLGEPVLLLQAEQVEVVGLQARRRLAPGLLAPRPSSRPYQPPSALATLSRDLVLDREQVRLGPVVALRPQVPAGGRVDELRRHPHPPAPPPGRCPRARSATPSSCPTWRTSTALPL